MKEVFEHAYEGFCNSTQCLVDFAQRLGGCVLVCFIYLTIPLWLIPYAIYKKLKEAKK